MHDVPEVKQVVNAAEKQHSCREPGLVAARRLLEDETLMPRRRRRFRRVVESWGSSFMVGGRGLEPRTFWV